MKIKMKNEESKKLKKQETTNYTNSTNEVKRFIFYYVEEIFVVNLFVLFVVKKMILGVANKKFYVFCGSFFSREFR